MQEQLTHAWEWIRLAASWAYHHPQFWPLALALLTWLCKPQTPAEYAKIAARNPQWFWTRWVEIMRLVGALGLDPIKVLKIIRKLAVSNGNDSDLPPGSGTGGGEIRAPASRVEGSAPPSGPSIIGAAAVLGALLCLTQVDCKPADHPREAVRGMVEATAKAVREADILCETAASRQKNMAVLNKCGDAYEAARYALIEAEDLLNAWDDAASGKAPCAVKKALEKLREIAQAIIGNGDKIPPVVDDAAKLAELYTGLCRE